ncbi:MAG: hypothetical protein MR881_00750 [Bacteroidales bacterium]|nr:hypothetical protein [Bacteroidales bacterium]
MSRAFSAKAAVGFRPPHTEQEKKPVKTHCNGLQIMASRIFHGFSLAAFEAGGEPTAAAGIKGEREPIRLTGSALIPAACPWGFKRSKMFLLVFI